jgi:hypothetical protein
MRDVLRLRSAPSCEQLAPSPLVATGLARRSLCDGSGAEGWNKRTLGSVVFGVQGKEGGWL